MPHRLHISFIDVYKNINKTRYDLYCKISVENIAQIILRKSISTIIMNNGRKINVTCAETHKIPWYKKVYYYKLYNISQEEYQGLFELF